MVLIMRIGGVKSLQYLAAPFLCFIKKCIVMTTMIHYMTTKLTKLKLKQAERDGPSVVVLGGLPTAIGGSGLVFIKSFSNSSLDDHQNHH